MTNQTRMAALRGMVGRAIEIRRGDVRIATGNLLGPLPLDLARTGKRRLWGAAYGDDDGSLRVQAFDPLDAELAIQLAM